MFFYCSAGWRRIHLFWYSSGVLEWYQSGIIVLHMKTQQNKSLKSSDIIFFLLWGTPAFCYRSKKYNHETLKWSSENIDMKIIFLIRHIGQNGKHRIWLIISRMLLIEHFFKKWVKSSESWNLKNKPLIIIDCIFIECLIKLINKLHKGHKIPNL